MGGEPTLHPDLLRIFSTMRVLGFHRRMMTTNGLLLTEEMVDGLNNSGMTDMSLSIDGVKRNATTRKVLNVLRRKLDILAERAQFEVVVSAVIGSAPREEVLEVIEFAKSRGFTPRVLVLHNEDGQMGLSSEKLAVYAEVKQLFGHRATEEAHGYRERLIQNGEAPFRCRAGARYLYIDEFGMVRWCAQTRMAFGKSLSAYAVEDLRQHFYSEKACSDQCCVGCVRTASALDQWRSQHSSERVGARH
jgi:MoaA/NifB/PqqE/SkfB family radical SAM enzyme